MNKEAVLECAEEIKKQFDASVEEDRLAMKKGLSLYRQGNVYNVIQDGNHIEGKVQDFTQVYDVSLYLDLPEFSICDCYQDRFCVHQLALFLSAYSSVKPVGDFLEEWKSHRTHASDIFKNQKANLPSNEQLLDSWLAFFEERYEEFKQDRRVADFYFASHIFHRYFGLLKNDAPKERELKRFYTIHAAITAFLKIIEEAKVFSNRTFFDLNSYVKTYLYQLIDFIHEEIEPLQNTILPFSFDPFVEKSAEHVREVLKEDDEFFEERSILYEVFWSSPHFPPKKVREVEMEKLYHIGNLGKKMLSYHLFIKKEDEQAVKLLTELTPIPLDFCFVLMQSLAVKKDWSRFLIWHQHLKDDFYQYIDHLNNYQLIRKIVHSYLQMIEIYAYENDKQSEYEEVIKQLFPYSFAEYSDYLFEKEEFKKWVELQLLLNPDLSDYGTKMLKIIENRDRESLLPLYHYGIKRAINERNRKSYKQAVRYLKKLRTHYRKLKKEPQWNAYLTRLVAENKRLRAFIEELQKGKLIDA